MSEPEQSGLKKFSLFSLLKGIKKNDKNTGSPQGSPVPESKSPSKRGSLYLPMTPITDFVQTVTNNIRRRSVSIHTSEAKGKLQAELEKHKESEESDTSQSSSKRNSLEIQRKARSKPNSPLNPTSPQDQQESKIKTRSPSNVASPDMFLRNSDGFKGDIHVFSEERRSSFTQFGSTGSLGDRSIRFLSNEEGSYKSDSELGSRIDSFPNMGSDRKGSYESMMSNSLEEKSDLDKPRSRRSMSKLTITLFDEDLEAKRKQKITDLLRKKSLKLKAGDQASKWTIEINSDLGLCTVNLNQKDVSIGEALVAIGVSGEYETLLKLLGTPEIKRAVDHPFRDMPPLHHIAQANQSECVELLIQFGASVDLTDKVERTALHMAVSNGANEAAVMLLAKGATPNIRDRYGNHPLQLAIKNHHFDIANDLMLFGADINFKKNDGSTILHEVLNTGDIETLEFFATISSKLNVNIKDSSGETPLFKAIARNKLDMLKYFIRNFKPKLSIINDNGQNVYHIGVKSGSIEALQCLSLHDPRIKQELINSEDKSKKQRPIHYAVQQGNYQQLASLLELQPDPNVRDVDGNTPLHFAVKLNNGELFYKVLLMHGAKTDVKNNLGEVPKKK